MRIGPDPTGFCRAVGKRAAFPADGDPVGESSDRGLLVPARGRPGPAPGSGSGAPAPRVVGPGRRELAYRARIERLEGELVRGGERRARLARRLETSQRLERGCQALLDRMEARAQADRGERRALEQRERRLVLALGALQRENELLQERLAVPPGRRRALPAAAAEPRRRPGFLARLLGRGGGRRESHR